MHPVRGGYPAGVDHMSEIIFGVGQDKSRVIHSVTLAGIRRFAERIPFAYALMAATEELSAADDRTVRFRLKRAFPHLPEALAGPGANVPAIMPERLAATSPFKPAAEIVGSGPYRFLPEEHISGARAEAPSAFALSRPRRSCGCMESNFAGGLAVGRRGDRSHVPLL